MYTIFKSQQLGQGSSISLFSLLIPLQFTYREYISSTAVVYTDSNLALQLHTMNHCSPPSKQAFTPRWSLTAERQRWVWVGIQPVLTFQHVNSSMKSLPTQVSVTCHLLFSPTKTLVLYSLSCATLASYWFMLTCMLLVGPLLWSDHMSQPALGGFTWHLSSDLDSPVTFPPVTIWGWCLWFYILEIL